MKVKIKKVYYKRSQHGRNPIHFHAEQPKGVGTNIVAELHIDPILRKKSNKDLRQAMVNHEKDEIKAWGNGCSVHEAHHHARRKEAVLTKTLAKKGNKGFWQEIKRRQQNGKKKGS